MNKKYVVGLLVLFAVLATSATFAFWASDILNPDNETQNISVQIGEGDEVSTTLTLNVSEDQEKTLVPDGFEDETTTYSTTTFTIHVEWEGNGAEGATGELTVSIDSLSLGGLGDSDIESMFTITLPPAESITAGTLLPVTVTVFFENEPADQAMYAAVADEELEIVLEFSVDAE